VPARAQVQVLELLQLARDVRKPLVGDVRTALDLEPGEAAEGVRDAYQPAVRELLAQRQVELRDVRMVFQEHLVQVLVLDVVTAAHVQRHQVGHVLHDLAQTLVSGHGQHLDPLDAALLEALVHRVRRPAHVDLRLDAAPHGFVPGGLAPRRAHLRRAALVRHVQVAEDQRQDLGVQPVHVSGPVLVVPETAGRGAPFRRERRLDFGFSRRRRYVRMERLQVRLKPRDVPVRDGHLREPAGQPVVHDGAERARRHDALPPRAGGAADDVRPLPSAV